MQQLQLAWGTHIHDDTRTDMLQTRTDMRQTCPTLRSSDGREECWRRVWQACAAGETVMYEQPDTHTTAAKGPGQGKCLAAIPHKADPAPSPEPETNQ
jgi:hypothetical protein